MNGAHALLATLEANDVNVCFANPGTSEMHFVAGLDDAPGMRAILCLFEGVATGAADGYARASNKPAATLLHLGPGLANGWANLHNARRARVPLINIVGDHATHHAQYDAPLQSDIDALAATLKGWQHRSQTPDDVALDAALAVARRTDHRARSRRSFFPRTSRGARFKHPHRGRLLLDTNRYQSTMTTSPTPCTPFAPNDAHFFSVVPPLTPTSSVSPRGLASRRVRDSSSKRFLRSWTEAPVSSVPSG